MSWRLASSLQLVFDEVQKRWSGHNHNRDGSIGDAAHARVRSGHNPDSRGVVHAIDVDINGIDPSALVRAIIADGKRRLRVWYVIYDRRIYSRTHGWAANYYDGSDPHTGHVHIELINELNPRYGMSQIVAAENNLTGWGIAAKPARAKRATYVLESGDTLSKVATKFHTSVPALVKANGIRDADKVPAGLTLVLPGGRQPKIHLDWAQDAVENGRPGSSRTFDLLDYWLPGRGSLKLRYSREQKRQNYTGKDADGGPGIASLTKLAARFGWGATEK